MESDSARLPTSYECPVCLRTTVNENDIAAGYCPCCGSAAMPRQCQHPRLYENPLPNQAGPGGKSEWYLYRTLCSHGYAEQQVVRPPGGVKACAACAGPARGQAPAAIATRRVVPVMVAIVPSPLVRRDWQTRIYLTQKGEVLF